MELPLDNVNGRPHDSLQSAPYRLSWLRLCREILLVSDSFLLEFLVEPCLLLATQILHMEQHHIQLIVLLLPELFILRNVQQPQQVPLNNLRRSMGNR
jgi:hypothetical protein